MTTFNEEEFYETLSRKHGLPVKLIKKLRNEAQTPWMGATIAHLKFEASVKLAKRKIDKEKD